MKRIAFIATAAFMVALGACAQGAAQPTTTTTTIDAEQLRHINAMQNAVQLARGETLAKYFWDETDGGIGLAVAVVCGELDHRTAADFIPSYINGEIIFGPGDGTQVEISDAEAEKRYSLIGLSVITYCPQHRSRVDAFWDTLRG